MTSISARPDTQPRSVRFQSRGVDLAGDLFLPDGTGPWPSVVLTGPFSSVKEQATRNYARGFAARGVAALAFDHRGWGASDGEPRCHESTASRVADLREAVSYLRTLDDIDPDRIALCGVCFGSIAAAILAAFDPRVRALAVIGGAFNRPDRARERFGPAAYDSLMAECAEAAQRQYETGELVYWPALDRDRMPTGMFGPEPYAYYGTDRGHRPTWENRCTAMSVQDEFTTSAWHAYPMLHSAPLLVVHGRGDEAIPLGDAEAAVRAAPQPKRLVVVEAHNHIDLYDVPALVDEAIDAAIDWFGQHLATTPLNGGAAK